MKELAEILKDLEQGKISADYAEEKVLRLFDFNNQKAKLCPTCKTTMKPLYDKMACFKCMIHTP
jgi:hypothetical protein